MPNYIKNGLRPGSPKDLLAARFEIENEGTYQFKQLYKWMYEWLLEHGWSDMLLPGNQNFEHLYLERVLQSGDMEHHIWWRCQKNPYDSGYLRYALKVEFQTLGMGKTEIVKSDKKFKTYKGDLILRVESWLQLDYKEQWAKHWLLKNFDEIFRKRIYKKNIENFKKDLYIQTYEFEDMVKQFLKLKTSTELPRSYHPELGV